MFYMRKELLYDNNRMRILSDINKFLKKLYFSYDPARMNNKGDG